MGHRHARQPPVLPSSLPQPPRPTRPQLNARPAATDPSSILEDVLAASTMFSAMNGAAACASKQWGARATTSVPCNVPRGTSLVLLDLLEGLERVKASSRDASTQYSQPETTNNPCLIFVRAGGNMLQSAHRRPRMRTAPDLLLITSLFYGKQNMIASETNTRNISKLKTRCMLYTCNYLGSFSSSSSSFPTSPTRLLCTRDRRTRHFHTYETLLQAGVGSRVSRRGLRRGGAEALRAGR